MSDLRTPEVEDLLTVLAGIEKNDDAYALLEDLFTVREIKDISQRLSVARLLKEGKLHAFKIGRIWKISRQSVIEYVNHNIRLY